MTVVELQAYLRKVLGGETISDQAIRNHMNRAGLTTGVDHKVDVAKFLAAYTGAKERDNKYLPPVGTPTESDPRRMKVMLECAILKLKLDELKGAVVPLTDMQAAIREMATWVRDTHAQWIADVKVLTGDGKVVADAERLRDNLFARIREKTGEDKA
jgi:hypothetical protein